MSIRCGHCKETHGSVAEVKACSRASVAAQTCDCKINPLFGHEDSCRYVGLGSLPAAPAQTPLEPGLYRAGSKVYRLEAEGSWKLLTSSGFWAGRARAPYRPERMTVEEVAAEGRRLVRCIVCGTRLTDPRSIERGIGPICATKI